MYRFRTWITSSAIRHNHRIVEGIAKHLHTDLSRFYENIEFYGNTSAASIPIALCDMQEQELLHRGERMVLAGFGSGLTWGSVLHELVGGATDGYS